MKKVDEVTPDVKPDEPRKSMEIARSKPMDLRSMRQVSSALYVTIRQFMAERSTAEKTLATAEDTASEYNWLLNNIDDFYARARHGIGNVEVYLVAESTGFTKQMEVFIKEKDKVSLAK